LDKFFIVSYLVGNAPALHAEPRSVYHDLHVQKDAAHPGLASESKPDLAQRAAAPSSRGDLAFIDKARKLGIKNICVHKGIPFDKQSYEHSLCNDIGKVAKRYPDVNFLIYHSGFVPGQPEGPYDPARNEGIDSLIKTVVENDVPRNSNVYAELGSTWHLLMRDPQSATHALGKLFEYIGEDNVLWGTDSIWYGSPPAKKDNANSKGVDR